MLAFCVVAFLFVFANAEEVTCTSSSTCASGTFCVFQEAVVSMIDPDELANFNVVKDTKTVSKSTCEDDALDDIMEIDSNCQTASSVVDVEIPDCSGGDSTLPIPEFLAVEINFGSTEFSSSDCVANDGLSELVTELVGCLLTDDFIEYVGCNFALPDECDDWLNETLQAYPECACNAIFDHVGVPGYAYIPTINGWVQEYLGNSMSSFEVCDTSIVDVDCTGLIENCLVNEDLYLNICDEISQIPDDAEGYIEVQMTACATNVPKNLKRSFLWQVLKDGITQQFEADDVVVSFDAYVKSSKAKRKRGKNNKVTTTTPEPLFDVDLSCDQDDVLVAVLLRLDYEDWSDLVALVEAYKDDAMFAIGVALIIVDLTIGDDSDGKGLIFDPASFSLDFTLYAVADDGTVTEFEVDLLDRGGAARHGIYTMFAVLVVAIMANE